MYDLIVIGGGPAGMLGAATAGGNGLKVVLIEKNNRLGKKLSLTGNGRCNVTNYGSMDDFQRNIVTNGKFLYSSLVSFDNHRLITLLHSLGVKVKVEQNNRVFPASDKSGDIVDAMHKYLRANNVELRFNTEVVEVTVRDNRVSGVLLGDNSRLEARKVLLATGGLSYRQTGSTGDGYKMAKNLGHTIVEPRPALVPLVTGDKWVGFLQGVALEKVKLQALIDKPETVQTGELLFTHFGVSGPAVLNLSSFLRKYSGFPAKVRIDLLPFFSSEHLEDHLRLSFKQNPGKLLKNTLGDLLPRRMIPVILGIAEIDLTKQVDQVGRRDMTRLTRTLKNLIININGTRPLNEAIVTGGGISTAEINPSTLESKKIGGLYFAGEVIDVDALTGGYNLQIAFSTGYLSGASAALRQ